MEAQGDLLADYFMLKFFSARGALAQQQYLDALPLFEQVLADFLLQPADPRHLPGGYRIFRSRAKHRQSEQHEGKA